MKNCPKCNSKITELDIKDCGYSSFNVGSVTCSNCSFELTIKCVEEVSEYKRIWNIQIEELEEILKLKKENLKDFIILTFQKDPSFSINIKNNILSLKENKNDIEKTKEILKKEKLDFIISEKGTLLVPKILLKFSYTKFLKETLKIPLKIEGY